VINFQVITILKPKIVSSLFSVNCCLANWLQRIGAGNVLLVKFVSRPTCSNYAPNKRLAPPRS